MSCLRTAKVKFVAVGVAAALIVVSMAVFAVPAIRQMLGFSIGDSDANAAAEPERPAAARLIKDGKGRPGLRLTKLAVDGLQIKPVAAEKAKDARPLPPQIGTINFDNETLFSIPSRFVGEVAEIRQIEELDPENPSEGLKKRPLRYGDRVKQGTLLCVVHSTSLGTAKAALVDAVCSLTQSKETLDRHYTLFTEGSISLAQLRQSQRQVLTDSNSVLTAERTLLTMKLTEKEVQEVKDEAKKIAELAKDENFKRDAKAEAEKWARVEIRVPTFDKDHPERQLVIVEKNTNLYSMVDPINTNTPLFRLADLTRLQIWVHPPEELLPVYRKMLESSGGGGPLWNIEFQAYPQDKLPPMRFTQIAPSLEPYQHTPMLMGYLDNPKGTKYVVGQFVTATIFVDPDPDTVQIPTKALNEVNGEALVFVQPDPTRDEFFLRRVAVVHRFHDLTFVRTKLTDADRKQNELDIKKRPLEPLLPNERVVTQGVVELTAALEELLTKEGNK